MRSLLTVTIVVGLTGTCLFLGLTRQRARVVIWSGNKALAAGRIEEALTKYQIASAWGPKSGVPEFNSGVARYAQGRFPEASERFAHAAGELRYPQERSAADYSLGNALAESGRFPEALEAYKQALRLNPSDGDARYNLTLVRAWLAQRERQTGTADARDPKLQLTTEEVGRLLRDLSATPIRTPLDPGRRSRPQSTVDR